MTTRFLNSDADGNVENNNNFDNGVPGSGDTVIMDATPTMGTMTCAVLQAGSVTTIDGFWGSTTINAGKMIGFTINSSGLYTITLSNSGNTCDNCIFTGDVTARITASGGFSGSGNDFEATQASVPITGTGGTTTINADLSASTVSVTAGTAVLGASAQLASSASFTCGTVRVTSGAKAGGSLTLSLTISVIYVDSNGNSWTWTPPAASYTAASNVRNGTNRGDGTLGTCHVPTASQVLDTVPVDATTGNVVLPDADNVLASAPKYGPGQSLQGTASAGGGGVSVGSMGIGL